MLTPEEKKERARIASRKFYQANREREKIRSRKWRQENPDKYRAWAEKNIGKRRAASRKFEYNLLPEQHDAKLKEQDGKCALCWNIFESYDVDHDHSCCSQRKTCGKCTRGLLCHGCNTACFRNQKRLC